MTPSQVTDQVESGRAQLQQPVLGLPDPGERVPALALPTVGLYLGTLGLFALEMTGLLLWSWSPWVTVPMGAAVTFLMFSVLHEAIHHAASSHARVNNLLGHVSMPFIVAWATYPLVKFIHIEHHRNTNEQKSIDPDGWTDEGPWWQLPFRWATLDLWYLVFYARHLPSRPRREIAGAVAMVAVVVSAFSALVAAGHGYEVLWGYLIPQRVGVLILSWWFDYLPHHGLTATQREDKYRATRVRVGGEGVLTPLFVYQNYHLVHHLHPSVPFYSYIRAWRRNEEAYLDRNAAISTWFGRSLTPSEYRTWRRIVDPMSSAASSAVERAVFHPLRVRTVERLTPESCAVTFDVPDDLAAAYRYVQGQHVTVRAVVDGQEVRRTYSITEPVSSGMLTIAVKRIDAGVFSTYATTRLAAGDILDVMTPAGQFHVELDASGGRHVVAVAVGSGITPIMSTIATMLEAEPLSTFTLIYGNSTRESTMFRDRIDDWAGDSPDRLTVHHVLTRDESAPLRGRIGPEHLTTLVDEPTLVDTWFLCGPQSWVQELRSTLRTEAPGATVMTEVFHVEPTSTAVATRVSATVTVRTSGKEGTFVLDSTGESILDAALRAGMDPPYSCAGGACGTCTAKVVLGDVVMDQNHALGDQAVADGYVLTCQSHPVTDEVCVEYDG